MEELTLHAFRYLKEKRNTFGLLVRAAGPGTIHEKLAEAFKQREYQHGCFLRGQKGRNRSHQEGKHHHDHNRR